MSIDQQVKVCILVLILFLVGCFLIGGFPTKKKIRGHDDHSLKQWYLGYNETLFGNELPKDVDVFWSDLSEYEALGMTSEDGDHFKIEIDKEYNVAEVTRNETLIHEMCHVEVAYIEGDERLDHGPKWQGCMLRIAEHGGFKSVW